MIAGHRPASRSVHGPYRLSLSCLLLGAALVLSAMRPPVSAAPLPSPAAARTDPVFAYVGLWTTPAAPGFGARLISRSQVVDRRNRATFKGELAAVSSAPDAIGLVSWNKVTEHTHTEPSCDNDHQSLTVLSPALGGVSPTAPDDCGGDAARPTPPTSTIVAPVATPLDLATGVKSDFDSSSPGGTTTSLYGVGIVGALTLFLGACLIRVVQRARKPDDRALPTPWATGRDSKGEHQ